MKIYKTIVLLLMTMEGFSQVPKIDAGFLSGDQKLVRMAVDSALCILRTEYTLANRSGFEYGRNGKDYFGRMYTVGVVSGNKVWADSKILRPWETDENFDKFKAADSIKPRISGTSVRLLVQPAFTPLKEGGGVAAKEGSSGAGSDSTVSTFPAPDSLHNISLVRDGRDRGGWLVVVAGKEAPGTNDSLPVSYTIYKAQPQFGATGSKGYLKNMPVKENVLGGVYFISRIELGKILFTAAGLLGKDKTGWYVQSFPGGSELKKNEDLTPLNK